MFKKVDHVELVPTNMERSLKFYTEILGFKIQWRHKAEIPPVGEGELVFIELGDTLIELFSAKNPAPASKGQWQVGYRRIALQVEDLDKAIKYLKAKGVEISSGPVAVEGPVAGKPVKLAEIKDPDGLSIELIQRG
jgi:glyoxylase I family protein